MIRLRMIVCGLMLVAIPGPAQDAAPSARIPGIRAPQQCARPGPSGRRRAQNRHIARSKCRYSHSRNTSLSFYAGAGRWDAVTAFSFPGAGPHPVAHLFSVEIVRLF